MANNYNIYDALPDTALAKHFREAGESLGNEATVLGTIIRNLLATEGKVSNKSVILRLIMALEATEDEAQAATLRRTLEIVVGYTPDDA
ncbi:two-component-system connector protein AriR [Pantoea sp. Mb-10]|uniref:biofilm development regulator YmgB/AriR family protein n=1 Tax=unclassified Pantoea TaxID=2630326 RepID=UPI001E2EE092|nr:MULTISPECIES: biofilm development regulator YmgB/AriR family protein [unclassified Pantoea]MCE0490701.1 two-component-system connector protein AriR [Pantoea sp. Mb-10]MCE0500141.1 two-component-system connector protein AriR [Pantoea sp. Pb-8]